MITRKIIQFGKSSFVCSLPKTWIVRNNLGKGAQISVDDLGTELRISVADVVPKFNLRKTVIDARNSPLEEVTSDIIIAYLTNHSIIEVLVKKYELTDKIKAVLRNLSSMEIIEETSDRIVAKDLLDINEVNISILVRRIDVTLRSMLDEVADKAYMQSIISRDSDVNRLVFLAYRAMRIALLDPNAARQIGASALEILSSWNIITNLERIGDCCKIIAIRLGKITDKKVQKQIKGLTDLAKSDYCNCMKAHYTRNIKLAKSFELDNQNRKRRCNDFSNKHNDPDISVVADQIRTMFSCIKHVSRSALIGMDAKL